MSMSYTKEDLKEAYNSKLPFAKLITAIDERKEQARKEKAAKKKAADAEAAKWGTTNDEEVLSKENVEESEIDGLIKAGIKKMDDYISDIYDEDIPDGGIDHDAYWLIGDRLFHSVVHFDSYWLSEWSSRCNVLEGDGTELSRKEITDFEITYNDGECFNAKFRK